MLKVAICPEEFGGFICDILVTVIRLHTAETTLNLVLFGLYARIEYIPICDNLENFIIIIGSFLSLASCSPPNIHR